MGGVERESRPFDVFLYCRLYNGILAMGFGFVERHQFANSVTEAFSAQNIQATQAKIGPIADDWDHLDILQRLDLLPFIQADQLDAYRGRLGIPQLHQDIIGQAMKYALAQQPTPTPIVFHVIDGPVEGVTVTTSATAIYVTVIRQGYDTKKPA